MSKNKKTITAVALCAAVAVAGVSLMGMRVQVGGGGGGPRGGGAGGEADTATTQVTGETRAPEIGSIVVTGEFIGTVEPNQQVYVYPKMAGEVLAVNFKAGDTVEKGDVLCELDSSELRNTIAKTQASLAISEAKAKLNLEIAEQNLEDYQSNLDEGLNATLLAAEASVKSAENDVWSASQSLAAARRVLREANNGESDVGYSDQEIDSLRDKVSQAEITLESRQLALEKAEANLRAVQQEIKEKGVSTANSVRSAELGTDFSDQYITLQQLQDDLNDAYIAAPISGVVEQRNVEVYDMASTQNPVYVISNKDAMTVSFSVAKTSLQYMRAGDAITIEEGGETCTGVITEISTMVDSSSGLFTVKAIVENPTMDLLSGSKVKIFASTKKAENEMMLPIDSVYHSGGEAYVFVYENGTAVRKVIETGISNTEYIQVVSGLSLGDQVISTWSSHLMDGAEVVLAGNGEQAATEAGQPAANADGENAADSAENGEGTDASSSGTEESAA